MKTVLHIVVLLGFFTVALPLAAQPADTLSIPETDEVLDSALFRAKRPSIEILPAPGVSARVPVSVLKKIPSVLGLADPLRFVYLLPSVQTGDESDSGLHIQGCENAHNYISMGGAPIYGAGHMFGFASVFNAGHFREMSYSTIARDLNRLGGVVDLQLPEEPLASTSADLSVGLFLSQATVRIPAGKHTFVLSGRHSYFNLLYSDFMKFNDAPLRYDFGDANATWTWRPGERDIIQANGYFGRDAAEYGAPEWQIKAWGNWKNAVGSLDWRHEGNGWSTDHLLYGSLFCLNDFVEMDVTAVSAPSSIYSLGYKGRFRAGGFELLAETARHFAEPLQPTELISISQRAYESSLQAGYRFSRGPWFFSASLRGTWYLSPEDQSMYSLDPRMESAWTSPASGTFSLRTGIAHQYLFQTGPTNMGLPSEYWILAGDLSDPQSSRYVSLAWNSDTLFEGWNIAFEGYYRDLTNQLEYSGNLLDYANPAFDLEHFFIRGRGRNYGINLSLQKTAGRLTGWLSYAWGRSLRHSEDPGLPEWYPSQHERVHEVKLVGTYDFGKWDVGMNLVVASGRPWTEPLAFYLLGGKIMTVFDDYNGGRLKPYVRADLSANWYFHKTTSRRDGINFSVYNATARPNELARMIKIDEDGRYYYGPVRLLLSVMPSVGYFLQF